MLEFAALVHLDRDVTTADQLAIDIELRESRPIGIGLQRFAYFRILENIDVRELGLAGAQRAYGLGLEPALRKIGGALHIEDHGGGRELVLDPFDGSHSIVSKLSLRVYDSSPGAARVR